MRVSSGSKEGIPSDRDVSIGGGSTRSTEEAGQRRGGEGVEQGKLLDEGTTAAPEAERTVSPKLAELVARARKESRLTNVVQFVDEELLRLAFRSLRKVVSPRLIHTRVSGYGPRGPLRDYGAFDFIIQGFAGMMTAMGPDDVEVSPPLTLIIDQATSMMAAYSVIAALYHRERTGRGQQVHTSLVGTTVSLNYFHYLSALFTGRAVSKHSRVHPGNPLRNYYRCSDGKWIICAHNPPGHYAERFFRCLGLNEDYQQYEQARGQTLDGPGLIEKLDRVFAGKTRDE